MAKIRYKQTNAHPFYGSTLSLLLSIIGNFLYDQKVSKDHFLRKLSEIVDWNRFTRKLLGYYQGKGEIGQGRGVYQSNPWWTC